MLNLFESVFSKFWEVHEAKDNVIFSVEPVLPTLDIL